MIQVALALALGLPPGADVTGVQDKPGQDRRAQEERQADALHREAEALRERGQITQAQQRHEEALVLRRRLYPANQFPQGHPKLFQSLYDLGNTLRQRAQFARARPLLEEALAMSERLYDKERY